MNTQRITISLPHYIYENLIRRIKPGKVSRFITSLLEENIFTLKKQKDVVDDFFALRKMMPKKTRKEILAAIKKGRL